MAKFYVYEHWRTDRDECFYVGKGKGMRAFEKNKNRNEHYLRVLNKLSQTGHDVKIVIYCDNLEEGDAFNIEMERIAFWRGRGIQLCNLTIGGDGIRGIGEETLAKMRASSRKRWEKQENRKKHSEATKRGMARPEVKAKCGHNLGKKLPKEVGRKISAALKGRKRPYMTEMLSGESNPFYGKKHTPETLERISAKKRGSKLSEETKAKMRIAQKARRDREAEVKNASSRQG